MTAPLRIVLPLLVSLCAFPFTAFQASAKPVDSEWTEVERADLDLRAISDKGRRVLSMPEIDWKHAQTDHFVVHYEQAIFARKVARMAEFFYSYIAEDLQGVTDRVDGRSHIFIFRNARRWEDLRGTLEDVPEWAFSQVAGTIMWLQQAENVSQSGEILAHEMTHLVMNRFFTGRLPIWLNEGLAEYYQEFGYAAYKGIKKSKRAQFKRLKVVYPLDTLLLATTYPRETRQIASFYETSKYLVGYLLLDRDRTKFTPFMEDMLEEGDPFAVFSLHYGLSSPASLEKEFSKFAR